MKGNLTQTCYKRQHDIPEEIRSLSTGAHLRTEVAQHSMSSPGRTTNTLNLWSQSLHKDMLFFRGLPSALFSWSRKLDPQAARQIAFQGGREERREGGNEGGKKGKVSRLHVNGLSGWTLFSLLCSARREQCTERGQSGCRLLAMDKILGRLERKHLMGELIIGMWIRMPLSWQGYFEHWTSMVPGHSRCLIVGAVTIVVTVGVIWLQHCRPTVWKPGLTRLVQLDMCVFFLFNKFVLQYYETTTQSP